MLGFASLRAKDRESSEALVDLWSQLKSQTRSQLSDESSHQPGTLRSERRPPGDTLALACSGSRKC